MLSEVSAIRVMSSEVIDISPGNLDSSLYFFQPSVSHDVLCIEVKYCIGTWNVRSMNQGKLEVVKQEMARVNVDILGIMAKTGSMEKTLMQGKIEGQRRRGRQRMRWLDGIPTQ